MKFIYLVILVCSAQVYGQVGVIFHEDFGVACSAVAAETYVSESGAWSVAGSTGSCTNWYVGALLNGNNSGDCFSSCEGDGSLYIGSSQSYSEYFSCYSDRTVRTPYIVCSGYTNLHLDFDYLQSSVPMLASIVYFNNGIWLPLDTLTSEPNTCGTASAVWNHYSVDLPDTLTENGILRIGFRWRYITDFEANFNTLQYPFGVDDIEIWGELIDLDILPPNLVCPNTLSWGCDPFTQILNSIEINDEVDNYVDISILPEDWNEIGENQMIQITASDFSLNQSTCQMQLTFLDTEAPEFSWPEDLVFAIPMGQQSVMITDEMLSAYLEIVECSSYIISNDFESQFLEAGEYQVNWSVTDEYTNTSSFTQTFSVSQNPPQFYEGLLFDDANESNCISTFIDDGFICTGCTDDALQEVQISQGGQVLMSNLNTGCSNITGYIDYPPMNGVTSCNLFPGEVYNLFVKTTNGFTEQYAAWIDFNKDGFFDNQDELIGMTNSGYQSALFSFSFPEGFHDYGEFKMRVICDFFYNPITTLSACQADCYGECEDYTLYFGTNLQQATCGVLLDYTTMDLAYDDIDIDPVITQSPEAGFIVVDSAYVTLTATDSDGFSSDFSFWVWNSDPGPSIVCPADTVTFLSPETCTAFMTDELLGVPTTFSNCGETTFYHENENSVNEISQVVILWIVEDDFGRESTCTQLVEVLDVQIPGFLCPNDTTVLISVPALSAYMEIDLPSWNSTCSEVTFVNDFTNTENASAEYPLGNTLITYDFYYGNDQNYACGFHVNVEHFVCCPADFNCDGYIDITDLAILMQEFGCVGSDCVADIDNSGVVTSDDLMIFIDLIGDVCP